MVFVVYTDAGGYFRWRLFAANGRTVADSGEGYSNKQDCLHGIGLVTSVTSRTQFLFYRDAAGYHRWRLNAQNGRVSDRACSTTLGTCVAVDQLRRLLSH